MIESFIKKWSNILYLYGVMYAGIISGAGEEHEWNCERQIRWWKRYG